MVQTVKQDLDGDGRMVSRGGKYTNGQLREKSFNVFHSNYGFSLILCFTYVAYEQGKTKDHDVE